MKVIRVMGWALVCAVWLSSCSSRRESPTGTITQAGSTTVYPVARKLAIAFMDRYPEVEVKTAGGGSGYGISMAAEGVIDIGASSRELTPADPALLRHRIGTDGIAIVVHPSNPVSGLGREDIREIFSGRSRQWTQLGGGNGEILVVAREEGSGTRSAFEDLAMNGNPICTDAVLEPSNAAVRSLVSVNPDAVGFLSLGMLDHSIKPLSINGVACTLENCRSGRYPLMRPLYFLTKAAPKGLVKEYIDFCMGETGRKIVVNQGYMPE